MSELRVSGGVAREGLWFVLGPVPGTRSLCNAVNHKIRSMSRSFRAGETIVFLRNAVLYNRKSTFLVSDPLLCPLGPSEDIPQEFTQDLLQDSP